MISMTFNDSHPLHQRGLSLIELMVAMVIGVVILLAVSQIFINNSRISGEVARTGRQIENGVFALQLLEDEISNAGFWGETNVSASGTVPPLCPAALADLDNSMGYPVQPLTTGADDCDSPIKAGTEALALRRASTCALDSVNCQAYNVALNYLQVPACSTDANMGVPQVKLSKGGLTGQTLKCDGTLAPIYRYLSRVYYITDNDELARMELGAAGYVTSGALVDGVEALHFSYGIDADADGQVEAYKDAPIDDAELGDVAAVRIWLVARNQTRSVNYTDTNTYQLGSFEYLVPAAFANQKRQVYSTTVTLRNVAGSREVQ
jgi:type IV pilus assembly protein PilW